MWGQIPPIYLVKQGLEAGHGQTMCIQASLARCGGRASSWGCCTGPGAFSGGRSGPKQSTPRPPLLKGGKNLVSGRLESSNSGHICSDPREGKKAWETDSRDLRSLEWRWGRENWTRSCQMTPRPGECQNWNARDIVPGPVLSLSWGETEAHREKIYSQDSSSVTSQPLTPSLVLF